MSWLRGMLEHHPRWRWSVEHAWEEALLVLVALAVWFYLWDGGVCWAYIC